MKHQLQRYLLESERLSLCRGIVACYVHPQLAVAMDLPVKTLYGPMGTVELDVETLKMSRDVSVN